MSHTTRMIFAAENNPVTGRISHRPLPPGWKFRATCALSPVPFGQAADLLEAPETRLVVIALYEGKQDTPPDCVPGSGHLPGKWRKYVPHA